MRSAGPRRDLGGAGGVVAIALAGLVVGAGCFNPSLPDEPFACGTGGVCPPGYVCDEATSLCVHGGGFTPADASPTHLPDASSTQIDASPTAADAAPFACIPGMFQRCQDTMTALICNSLGDGYDITPCSAGCDAVNMQCDQCQAGGASCNGDTLVSCGNDGSVVMTDCPAGCNATALACYTLTPSNLPATTCDTAGTASRHITSSLRIDTTSCGTTGGAGGLGGTVVAQSGGLPSLCVFKFSDITVDPGVTIQITGSMIPVFVATDTLTLAGAIDVSGSGATGGAGATSAQAAGRGGFAGCSKGDGGGGAGNATQGGNGTGSGGRGAATGSSTNVPLQPGAFGGGGGSKITTTCPTFSAGGGGGGALQIVSCGTFTLAATANINAGGGGGPGGSGAGSATAMTANGGGGGGAGGAILIEAPQVTVPAGVALAANGGGGGGGGGLVTIINAGMAGSDGTLSNAPATGGAAAGSAGGAGGAGGTAAGNQGTAPVDGTAASDSSAGSGGGGGAAGHIRLNSRTDHPVTIAPGAVVSPLGNESTGSIRRH